MLSLVMGPPLGFVATGGPAVGRAFVTTRMLLEPSPFFLLSKIDLSQFRLDREALDSLINEIDGRIVVEQQEAALAAATTAPEAAAAAAAASTPATSGAVVAAASAASTPATAPGGLDVVAALLHPILPLLPIPAVAIPVAALYYAGARLRSPAEAIDGPPGGSGLLERGGAAAKEAADAAADQLKGWVVGQMEPEPEA